jgi:hypothetical protein
MLEGRATIGVDQGLFLTETRRLHPEVCAFTSELFYDGGIPLEGIPPFRVGSNHSQFCTCPVRPCGGQSMQSVPSHHDPSP